MNVRAATTLAIVVALSACSMSIPVTKVTEATPAEGEGTLLILPRTALTLKYTSVEKTFTAGAWTAEVEACEASSDDVKALEARASLLKCNSIKDETDQCKAIFQDKRVRNSCAEIADLELASKRFSKPPAGKICPSDGTDSEFRRTFDWKSIAVTGTPVPDPDQVYWVETPARLFGDTEVTVSYTASGTIAGAKSVSSNPFATFGVELAGIGLKSILGLAGGEDSNKSWSCLTVKDEICNALRADLKSLKALLESEAKFLTNTTRENPDVQAVLAAKQAQTAKARALFEGAVKTEEKPVSVTWIPLKEDRLLGRIDDPVDCMRLDPPGLPARNGECIEQLVCAGIGDTQPPTFPKQRLFFSAQRAREGAALAKVVSPTLKSTSEGDTHSRMEKRGFPYRAAIQSEANARVVYYSGKALKESPGTLESKVVGSMFNSQLAIAQFGEIGFLAPRAGGKSGTIDAKYFVDTGALETLSVEGVGADPAPVLDPVKAALTPSPATDPMKAEKERLETLKAICVAAAALNDPLPAFCKP